MSVYFSRMFQQYLFIFDHYNYILLTLVYHTHIINKQFINLSSSVPGVLTCDDVDLNIKCSGTG